MQKLLYDSYYMSLKNRGLSCIFWQLTQWYQRVQTLSLKTKIYKRDLVSLCIVGSGWGGFEEMLCRIFTLNGGWAPPGPSSLKIDQTTLQFRYLKKNLSTIFEIKKNRKMNHLTEEQSSPMPKFVLQNEAVPTPVIVNYNIPPHLAMQRGEYF